MRDRSRDLRDQVVRALARLSLIAVLALMGALFVGSAAVGGTAGSPETTSAADVQPTEQEQEGVLDDASPMGLLIGHVRDRRRPGRAGGRRVQAGQRERERVLAEVLRD